MSFLFELAVEDLTQTQAEAIARRTRRPGLWPVGYGERQGRLELGISDYLTRDRHILTDNAMWDAPAWVMEPDLLPLLAGTVRLLGEELPQGFAFRATWGGSEVRHERELDAEALASIVLASGLNEFTRYTVVPRWR